MNPDYSNSPHYMETIVKFTLRQEVHTQSDSHCDKPTGNIYLTMESLMNQRMYLYFRITREEGPVYINYWNDKFIEAHQIIDVGLIQQANNPPFLELSL